MKGIANQLIAKTIQLGHKYVKNVEYAWPVAVAGTRLKVGGWDIAAKKTTVCSGPFYGRQGESKTG